MLHKPREKKRKKKEVEGREGIERCFRGHGRYLPPSLSLITRVNLLLGLCLVLGRGLSFLAFRLQKRIIRRRESERERKGYLAPTRRKATRDGIPSSHAFLEGGSSLLVIVSSDVADRSGSAVASKIQIHV